MPPLLFGGIAENTKARTDKHHGVERLLYLVALLLTFAIPKNKEAIDYDEEQQDFSKIDPSFI